MPTLHLTAQTIKGLKAGDADRADYFDTDVTGFGLRVAANGIKSWIYLYRMHRRPRRFTIGRYPDPGESEMPLWQQCSSTCPENRRIALPSGDPSSPRNAVPKTSFEQPLHFRRQPTGSDK
jgi:Arm domain-containing DNA-binding protein